MEFILRDPETRVATFSRPFSALHYDFAQKPAECEVLCIVSNQAIIRERSPECDENGMPLDWKMTYYVPLSHLALLSDFQTVKKASNLLLPTGVRSFVESHKMLDYFDVEAKKYHGIDQERVEHLRDNLKKEISLHYAASENRAMLPALRYEDQDLQWSEQYLSYYNSRVVQNDGELIDAICLLNKPLCLQETDKYYCFADFAHNRELLQQSFYFSPYWYQVVEKRLYTIYRCVEDFFGGGTIFPLYDLIEEIVAALDSAQREDYRLVFKFRNLSQAYCALSASKDKETDFIRQVAVLYLQIMPFLMFCLSFQLSISLNYNFDYKYYFIVIARRFQAKLFGLFYEEAERLVEGIVCTNKRQKQHLTEKISQLEQEIKTCSGKNALKQKQESIAELKAEAEELQIHLSGQYFLSLYKYNGEKFKYELDFSLSRQRIVYAQDISEIVYSKQKYLGFITTLLSNLFCYFFQYFEIGPDFYLKGEALCEQFFKSQENEDDVYILFGLFSEENAGDAPIDRKIVNFRYIFRRKKLPGGFPEYYCSYCLDFYASDLISEDYRTILNHLYLNINIVEIQRALGSWIRNNSGYNVFMRLVYQIGQQTKNLQQTEQSVENSFLFYFAYNKTLFSAITVYEIFSPSKILEYFLLINTFPDALYFDSVKYNMSRLKTELTDLYSNVLHQFSRQIIKQIGRFSQIIESYSEYFNSTVLKYQYKPEKFSYLLKLQQLLNENALIDSFLGIYVQMCDFWVGLNDVIGFVLDEKQPYLATAEGSVSLILKYVSLAINIRNILKSIQNKIPSFCHYINNLDVWLSEQAYKLQTRIKEIMGITATDYNNANGNALVFSAKFPDICKNYEFSLFKLCRDPIFERYEHEFLNSLSKYTTLPLKSVKYNFYQIHQYYCEKASEYSVNDMSAQLYDREKITFKKNNISIPLIIYETCYITQQFYQIYRTIYLWRRLLNALTSSAEKPNEQEIVYPSFVEMNNAINPLNTMLKYEKTLTLDVKEQQLAKYDDAYRIECLDLLSQTIVYIRGRFRYSYLVNNSQYDFYKIGLVRYREDFLSFTINYDCWEEKVTYIEHLMIDHLYYVYFLFLVKSTRCKPNVECQLSEQFAVKFASLKDGTVGQALEVYEQRPELLDFFLTQYQEYQLDDSVTATVTYLYDYLLRYEYFTCVTLDEKPRTDDDYLKTPLLRPLDFETFFSRSMYRLQNIFSYTYLYLSGQLKMQRYHEMVINKIYQRSIAGFERRTLYSETVQLHARDLEAALQTCKKLFTMLRRIPLELRDLFLVMKNGNIVDVSGKRDGIAHQFNVLSYQQTYIIYQARQYWDDIVHYSFSQPITLLVLTQSQQILLELVQISKLLEGIHTGLYSSRFFYAIRLLTSQYNRTRNAVESSFALTTEYSTAFGASKSYVEFIPISNGSLYTKALLLPQHIQLYFSDGSHINQLLYVRQISSEVFCDCNGFYIQDEQIISAGSAYEELKLHTGVHFRMPTIYLLNTLKDELARTIKDQCRAATFEFRYLYQEYRLLLYSRAEPLYRQAVVGKFFYRYSYQAINIAVASAFRGIYTRYLFHAFTGKYIDKFEVEMSFAEDVPQQLEGVSPYKMKAIHARLAEWKSIFFGLMEIVYKYSGDQLLLNLNTFPILYYDTKSDAVLTVFNHGGFSLQAQNNYFAPLARDYYLTSTEMEVMVRILKSLQQRTTVVFTGIHLNYHCNDYLEKFLMALQNYYQTKTISVVVSEISFANDVRRICALLINGINVIVFGAELLSDALAMELLKLIQMVYRYDGTIWSFVSCFLKYDAAEQQTDFSNDLEYIYHYYSTRNVNFSYFRDCGQIMLYLPVLQLAYSLAEPGDRYIVPSLAILNSNKNQAIVQMEFSSMQEQFELATRNFSKYFYTMAISLNMLNDDYPKFGSQLIELIFAKTQDKNDPLSVAVMTMDLLLHYTVQLYFEKDSESVARYLSNIVASAFGLQKQEQNYLFRVATYYCRYISSYLFGYSADQTVPLTFEQYFDQYLQRYANQMYLFYIQVFSKVQFLPIQMLCDVLYINDFFKSHKPILAISTDSQYSRIFVSMLAAIKDWEYDYVVGKDDLDLVLQQSMVHTGRQRLIGIQSTSFESFAQIFGHLIGFGMQKPAITTNFGRIVYYDSPEELPFVICFVNSQIVRYLRQSRYYGMFYHKIILTPVVENSVGVHQIVQAPVRNALSYFSYFMKTLGTQQELYCALYANMIASGYIHYAQHMGPPIQTVLAGLSYYCGAFPKSRAGLYLSRMYMNFMHGNSQVFRENELKIFCLRHFASGVMIYFFEQVPQLYRARHNMQEVILLRSLMYFFLVKIGVLTRSAITPDGSISTNNGEGNAVDKILYMNYQLYTDENAYYSSSYGNKNWMHEMMSASNTLYVEEGKLLYDISCFYSTDIQEYNKFARSLGNQSIDKMVENSVNHFSFISYENLGLGQSDNTSYYFNYDFLARFFLSQGDHITAFKNMGVAIIIAVWNACHLFSVVTSKYSLDYARIYECFTALLKMLSFKYNSFYMHMLQPFAYLLALKEGVSSINKNSIRFMTQYTRSTILDLKLNLQTEYIVSCIQRLHTAIFDMLPEYFAETRYYYLALEKTQALKVYVYRYSFGHGIFRHFHDDTEVEILRAMKRQLEDQQELAKNCFSPAKYIAGKYCFESKIYEIEDICAFQHIDGDSALYLDNERVAFCCLLAAAMMTPLSVAVLGNRAEGKSVLINIAKLIAEDVVDDYYMYLQSFSNFGDVEQVITAVVKQFRVATLYSRSGKQYRVLNYGKTTGYPCFHFYASECIENTVIDELSLLLRDHIVYFDIDHFYESSFYGTYTLGDSSLIVELASGSSLYQHCNLALTVPRINEEYIRQYLQHFFSHSDKKYLEEYISGFFMIRYSFPPEIYDNYVLIQKMVENTKYLIHKDSSTTSYIIEILDKYSTQRDTDEMQRTDYILECAQDDVLTMPNMHYLFYAMRYVGCVNNITMQAIAERISSLTLLGYMQSGAQSPWGDSDIVSTGRFMFYNGWESFLINYCVKNSHTEGVQINSEFIKKQVLAQKILLPREISEIPCDDGDLLLAIRSYVINNFWFGHVIESVKRLKEYDPLLLSKGIEVFLQIFSRKQQNTSFFKILGRYGMQCSMAKHGDGLMPSRLHLISGLYECGNAPQQVQNIPTLLLYALQPIYYYINLQDSTVQNYKQFIGYLYMLSYYELVDSYTLFKDKIILDLRLFTGVIDSESLKLGVQEGAQCSLYSQLQIYFAALQKSLKTYGNAYIIVLTTVLRVALGLAIGVKPYAFLTVDNLPQGQDYAYFTSVFENDLQCDLLSGGLNISQIPANYSTSERMANPSVYENVTRQSVLKEYEYHIYDPVDVILVAPKSLLALEGAKHVSFMQLLEHQLTPFNYNSGLFSSKEMSVMCRIAAAYHKLDYMLPYQYLSLFFSHYFSVLVVNDDSAGKSFSNGQYVDSQITYSILNIRSLGTVKSPIVEFLYNIYKFYDSVVKDEYHEAEHTIEAVNVAPPQPPVRITDMRLIQLQTKCAQYKYNIIYLNLSDLVTLFNISNCKLPKQFAFPEAVKYNYKEFVHEYTMGTLQIYQFFANLVNGPAISLPQFTQLTSNIANLILGSCETFFVYLSNIFLAYRFYQILSNGKARSLNCDFQDFSLERMRLLVQEATVQSINGKEVQMADNGTQAQMEFVLLREYFMHVIDSLKSDFQQYSYAVASSHFDAICLASYTTFYCTGLVTDGYIYQILANLPMQDNNLKQQKLIERSYEDHYVCYFNLLAISRLLYCGFKVQYPGGDEEPGFVTVGRNAIVKDKHLFLSHFIDTTGYDWPIFMILRSLNVVWSVDDPYYYIIATAALYFVTGKSIFFMEEELAQATTITIEALKKQNYFNNQYYEYTRETLDLDEQLDVANTLTNELYKRIIVVDITCEPYDFEILLAKALGMEDCSIFVQNFGKSSPNNETLRNLVEMKLSGSVGRRALIKIGHVTAITNNSLSAYSIVLALDRKTNIGMALKNAGLLTYNILDNSYVGCQYNVSDQQSDGLAYQKYVISQLIVSACFGVSSTQRSIRERIRNCNQAEHDMLLKASTNTFYFVKQKLYGKDQSYTKDGSASVDQLWESISHLHISLQKHRNSAQYSSILQEGQQGVLQDLFRCYHRLQVEDETKQSLFDYSRGYTKSGTISQLQCQHFRFLNNEGGMFIQKISTAVITVQRLLENMSQVQTSLRFVLAAYQLTRLQAHLSTKLRRIPKLQEAGEENAVFELYKVNQLCYNLIFYGDKAVREITKHIIQFVDGQVDELCCSRLAAEVKQYLRFLFLSQVYFIHFQHYNVIETDTMKEEKRRENQEFMLLKEMLSFSFNDYLTLISGAQVLNIMSKSSKFSLMSYSVKNYRSLTKIRDVYPCLPDICKLASNIAFCWLGLSHLGLSDYYVESSLSWFVTHTSALISLTDSTYPFISCMLYYLNNGISQQTRFSAGIRELVTRYPSVQAIPYLPVAFYKMNDASIFSLLLVSIASKPSILGELLEQYNVVMDNLFNTLSYQSTEKVREASFYVPQSNSSLRLLNRLSGDAPMGEIQEFDILCDSMKHACSEIQANFKDPGISVYFYDSGCEMQVIMSFLIDLTTSGAIYVAFQFSLQEFEAYKTVFVLYLDYLTSNELKVFSLEMHRQQNRSAHLPIFILCQNDSKLSEYSALGERPDPRSISADILGVLHQMPHASFHYFERPSTLYQSFLYNLGLALATLHGSGVYNTREVIPVASFRGFSLLLLYQSLISLFGGLKCSDSACSGKIAHAHALSASALAKYRMDPEHSDFQQLLRYDYLYFSSEEHADNALEAKIKRLISSLLLNSECDIYLLPDTILITRESQSNTKADAEQLKQANNDSSSSEELEAVADEGNDTQTQRFNYQMKVLNNLIQSGGKIKSTQIVTNYVSRRQDDPLTLISNNMVQADARLEQVEEFYSYKFRSSVSRYFAFDREIIQNNAPTAQTVLNQFPRYVRTFADFLKLAQLVWEASALLQQRKASAFMHLEQHQAQRFIFSAPFSQKIFSAAQFQSSQQKIAQIPRGFRALISNLDGFAGLPLENRLYNMALQDLVLGQLTCQESNYFGAESIFLRFGNCYMVNCAAFYPVLGNILNFVRIKNALKTGTVLSSQQLVFTVEKPKKQAIINRNQEVVCLDDRPDIILQMRGFELIGAAYDCVLQSLCDETPESQSGFGCLMDIYAISCTCEFPGVVPCPGFVSVPLAIGGYCQGYVQLQNKTARSDAAWQERGLAFCIRKY